jgi:hypothetical protein
MSFKNANQAVQRFVLNWGNTARTYEIIRALMDARRFNTTINEEADLGKSGKLRKFIMTYMPILCNTEGSCTSNICDPGEVVEPMQRDFIPKQCSASKVYQIDAADLRLVDGNYTFSDHAIGIINSAFPDLRRTLALDMATLLIANAGLQPDGNPTRRMSFVNNTNGVINPTGQWEVERTFQDSGLGSPIIIGSGEVFTWQKAQDAAGLNAQGLNLTRLGATNSYYDALISQAVGDGADHIFAFDPTVLKFVTWSKNAGMFATDVASLSNLEAMYNNGHPTLLKGVLLDPATGISWDLNIHFDPCGDGSEGVWKFQLKLVWDIFFMPDIACNIQGLNGIFHYTTCPPVLAPCPTGDAIPDPAAAQTFSWNPAFAYPLYVHSAKVGGVESTPNVNVTSDADTVALLNDIGGGIHFTLVGANIQYTGYSAISGNLNDGNVVITFA